MVFCVCGEPIISLVGDGFVVTPNEEQKWLRRRSDSLACPACARRFVFDELKDLAAAEAS